MEVCPGIYLGCGGCPLGFGRIRLPIYVKAKDKTESTEV
jgi:hypothetical protein